MPFDRIATAMRVLIPWVNWIPGYHITERLVAWMATNITSLNTPPASFNGDANGHNDSKEILCSNCSVSITHMTGLKPNLPPVPVIPPSITGQCVYGHILNDKHRDHFRRLYPKVEDRQSSNPENLVSAVSLIHYQKGLYAVTADVYDQGHQHTCLVYVDCRFPGRVIDERWSTKFIEAIENTLGITGEPKWYPSRFSS